MPILRDVLAPSYAYWRDVRTKLAAGWLADEGVQRQVEAAVGHAIAFTTWYSLVREQDLDDAQAVELMVGMLRGIVATQSPGDPGRYIAVGSGESSQHAENTGSVQQDESDPIGPLATSG